MEQQWISAKKAKKMLKIDEEQLDILEKQGKVKTIQSIGNKLYLLSSLSEEKIESLPQETQKNIQKNVFKRFFSKVFSWLSV
jgi:hypothetical protein